MNLSDVLGQLVYVVPTAIILGLTCFLAGGFYFLERPDCVVCGRPIYFRPVRVKGKLLSEYVPEAKGWYIMGEFIPYHRKCFIRAKAKGVITA